ncbi:hypothetical protein NQ176_g5254 [Zarea fungicola]|uniref:Uncharacterized protein n=1 Tax=Zarea fungicola TaxID=93591 RepID=A0ACC1NAM0_9HYPO|nr:hypothetical protein NQ176_g5254 [Lecanicillium fungicola]
MRARAKIGFEAVRIYGNDCNTLTNVIPACIKEGLEVIAGIFIKPGGQCSVNNPDVQQQINGLKALGNWDVIRLIVAGNESAFNKLCTGAELAQLIKDVRSQCTGYTGPITCAETLNIWQEPDFAGPMCEVVDVVGANIHAIFNPDVTAAGAGDFVKGQIDILEKICGKNVINLETGWKHSGGCNGDACAGPSEQQTAIASIREKCGSQSVFFSFDDAAWKGDADAWWGLGDVFGYKAT